MPEKQTSEENHSQLKKKNRAVSLSLYQTPPRRLKQKFLPTKQSVWKKKLHPNDSKRQR